MNRKYETRSSEHSLSQSIPDVGEVSESISEESIETSSFQSDDENVDELDNCISSAQDVCDSSTGICASNIRRKRLRIYPCPSCKKMFKQYPSAVKHCKGKVKTAICPKCKKAKGKRNLKRHIESCGKVVEKTKVCKKCFVCSQIFSTKQRLDYHLVNVHKLQLPGGEIPAELHKCPHCEFAHRISSVVKVHKTKVHKMNAKIYCKEIGCEYYCFSPSGMSKHIKKVHSHEMSHEPAVLAESESNHISSTVQST